MGNPRLQKNFNSLNRSKDANPYSIESYKIKLYANTIF